MTADDPADCEGHWEDDDVSKQANCRGAWALGNNCGSCPRCRAEARAALAERDELRALIEGCAAFAADHGWGGGLAAELRRRAREIAERHEVGR